MKKYNNLNEQLNKYDDLITDIFKKCINLLDKIIINGNLNSSFVPNNHEKECNYFSNFLQSLYEKYQYNVLLDENDNTDNIYTEQSINIKKVCYQGLPFSYSESAAKSLFKDKEFINKKSFSDVFVAVHKDEADIGVVPIENSTAGNINDVYDLLLKYDLYINYNYIKKIEHCLAGTVDATIDDVEEVWSHPQAIMQCKNYIEMHNFKVVDETNTAVAAQKISVMNNKKAAAICSVEAANNYNLKVLDEKINHQEHNSTKFIAISKTLWLDESHNKVSIVFTVPHKTGTLNNVLSTFSYYNINLSSIYSRPDLKSPWKYLFYIDFQGNTLSHDVRAVLYQLKKELPFMKILGSYKA